ncbi:Lrp/AsnC family transcriptional regulator, leucine-responsive regulatory protein [Paenibacillus catalpae]|uniref:Lrp/AsnC family transcriptional regulator, leucine-responsive regulatory protein n=1 Tax=Paenibacillus catalpae TaxID=1045775 RepID=A0A1I2BMN7_9BACL|nr:Lrp/AsnC family transcriptional regulator [Paenibacillus catalpae]SFE57058.1 Lrp/AsnC family transcriptional regulator, leucine-responsive regulatory protein [Paenibacillus catalpae]
MLSSNGIDEIDRQILNCLIADASQTHKSIGEQVHLTGQAVGARVRKLQDLGIIEGTTVIWNPEKIGLTVHAFVTVFMKSSTAHQAFQAFASSSSHVEETHRVSGEGCYWMRVRTRSQLELTDFLDELLTYGNYKVSLSIGQVK